MSIGIGSSSSSASALIHSGIRPQAQRIQRVQPPGGYQSASLQSASEQDASLNIKTAEGDTVKISFQALRAQQASASDSPSGSAASTASGSSISASIEVQGSLSDQEVSDIKKLLTALGSAVKDAGSGNAAQAAQDLQQAGSLDTIQGFDFSYQQSSLYRAGYQKGSIANAVG